MSMIHKESQPEKHPLGAERPFPWRCRNCGEAQVVVSTTEYPAEIRHDGRLHSFTISDLELPICQACGERVFTEKVDLLIRTALPGQSQDAELGMSDVVEPGFTNPTS